MADKEDDDWVGLVFSYQVVVGMRRDQLANTFYFLLQSANTFYALLSAKHCCGPTLSAGQRGKLRRQVGTFLIS